MQPNYQGPMPGANQPTGMAVASMVLGICSFALCWIPYLNFVTWITAILALILGMVARSKVKQGTGGGGGMATAGMVLGIVYLSLALLGLLLVILGFSMFGSAWNKAINDAQKRQQQGGSSMLPVPDAFEHVSAIWNILGSLIWR